METFIHAPLQSFLLLELAALAPSGTYRTNNPDNEEVVELSSGRFLERWHWDENISGHDDDGVSIPLPESAKLLVRWFRGKILIVSKGSIWNGAQSTYRGVHNSMTPPDIRRQIADALGQASQVC